MYNLQHITQFIIKTYTLTMQLPTPHLHGAVLGPLHTVCTGLLLVSLHKQLAVELQYQYS